MSSDDPCVIITTLIPSRAIEPNTCEATPTAPRIPEPIRATTATPGVTSTFLIMPPSMSLSRAATAPSMSRLLTTMLMLDSDGFCDIIVTLAPAPARVENILAAVPGSPASSSPRTSMSALPRSVLMHLTGPPLATAAAAAAGSATTSVPPGCAAVAAAGRRPRPLPPPEPPVEELRTRMGMPLPRSGSNVRGCICFAPNMAISMASMYETVGRTRAPGTIDGSAVKRPSTSLISHISPAPMHAPTVVAV